MTKQVSRELLKKLAAKTSKVAVPAVKKAASKKKPAAKTTRRRKRTRKKASAKKRVSYTKSNVVLHPKVKALISKIKTKETHGVDTLKKFSLKAFRMLLAAGCKKCKGTSLNKDGNYCNCINEISDGNFIYHCDQYYAWYYSCVDYALPKAT